MSSVSKVLTLAPVALVTGSSQRLGAHIATSLHARGMRVVIHYCQSEIAALALSERLNQSRSDSCMCLKGDLTLPTTPQRMVESIQSKWGRLDLLVNNAALFYPTPMRSWTVGQWDQLMAVNLRAPALLSQAASSMLAESAGSIVNIVDVYAERPRPGFSAYCASKSGLVGLTRALARDLAPDIRVNAVAPGAILWSQETAEAEKSVILAKTPLARMGLLDDIAEAVCYLADASYVTGHVLNIDGGRSIYD